MKSKTRETRLLTTFGVFSALALASAQTIPNPSFEANSFTNWPGYISSNSPIAGWTTTNPDRAGLNPASGRPFADNGAIPDGANVAFIQSDTNSSLSTVISGLTVGETYKVNFRVNARSYLGTAAILKIDVAGTNIINTTVAAVGSAGSSNSYQYFAFDFKAAAPTQTLTLRNDATDDATVLVDNFSIGLRNSGWSYAAWNDDATSGVVATNNYTHAYKFGSTTGTNINGIHFTGIPGGNPSNTFFSTIGLPNVSNNDTNNLTNGGSAVLGRDFLWGGAVQSITINGLTVGKSYVATIYSVGYDTNGARAATFSVGDDRLTVNQDQFGNDNGIRVSCYYTAGSSRLITLTYVPLSGSTFHTYGFANYEVGPVQIVNPSFEANSFTASPGYISGNTNIVGWTTTDPGSAGLNPASGSPFADNGTVSHGNNVAFIQSSTNSSLSTVISNLTVGATYKVNFRVNARAFLGTTANLKVDIAGTNVINTTVAAVGGAGSFNPYQFFAFDFTAAAATQTLTLRNDATKSDNTVLVDDFSIAVRNSGWSYAAWNDDASSGVVATNNYTHAFHFGSTNATTINGVTFTGIPVANPSHGAPNSFSTIGLSAVANNDTNNLTTGSGGSAALAHDFVYGGNPATITINGLVVGNSYVATIYSVGYDTNGARAATFSVGNDRLTVNQDQFGDNNGIRVSYYYTVGSSRSITLFYFPLQGDGQTFHTYGFANYQVSNSHPATLFVTSLADSGPGTLRRAIADAESGDTIKCAANGTITLASSPLFLAKSLNISGPGPASLAVDGNLAYRVFELGPGLTSSISGLTIQNGRYPNGGGLGNFGTMVLSNCVITGNAANGVAGFGGAIHNGNSGLLSLIACTVSNNRAGDGAPGADGADGTLSHHDGYPGSPGGLGGNGGGIYNEGVLSLTGCTIYNNSAGKGGQGGAGGDGYLLGSFGNGNGGAGGGNGGDGGCIYNDSSASALVLIACTVSNNFAGDGGNGGNGAPGTLSHFNGYPGGAGGSSGNGGGIYNEGALAMTACTINNNTAGIGGQGGVGGILKSPAIELDTYYSGTGGSGGDGGSGGGEFNGANATLALTNCTIYGNTAGTGGVGGTGGRTLGGISEIPGDGGNGGKGGNGGGVYNDSSASGLALTACTVSSNNAGGGGFGGTPGLTAAESNPGNPGNPGNGGDVGGIYTLAGAVSHLRSTLVAQNKPGAPQIGFDSDLWGTNFLSHSNNLVGYHDYFTLVNQNNTDIVPVFRGQTNAMLAPLGDYGGPTPTVALLPGSPAIDAGDDTLTNLLATDQRGFARQSLAHVDIGAYEMKPLVVLNANDSGPDSLRNIVANGSPVRTIFFDPSLSGQTIHLTSGQLTIGKSCTIDASALPGGVAIDAGGNFRVLEITASNLVTLDSITVINGRTDSGGGILVNLGAALTIVRCGVSANSATDGGGIASYGALTVSKCRVVGNSADLGGGINNSGTLTMNDSVVSGNSANFGGGICDGGTLTMNGSTVSSNLAPLGGGLYFFFDGHVVAQLLNSTVAGNSGGGGIHALSLSPTNPGVMMINCCTLSGNSGRGGIYATNVATRIYLTIVTGNNPPTLNLSIGGSLSIGTFDGRYNLTNGNPLLAPLGAYGGPTPTMRPLPGSPAIDAGLESFLPGPLLTDQRGYPRRSGSHVDIGAVEAQWAPAANPPLLTNPAQGSEGAFSFSYINVSIADFTVLTSTNLSQWEILGAPVQYAPGQYQFTDRTATNYPQRFYRVVSP